MSAMDFDLLDQTLAAAGERSFRVKQVRHAVTRSLVGGWDEMTTLSTTLRSKLADAMPFSTLTVEHAEHGTDGSVKLRMATLDGFPVEAVLMRFETREVSTDPRTGTRSSLGGAKLGERFTVCLSSQSGCALACTFCATGAMGLGRSLTRYEIYDQFLALARLRGGRIDNVVMMGMGEPFHNYDEVLAACRLMNDPDGTGLAARRMAISTVGWIPGIDRLAKEDIQVKLALSLHAPNDEVRSQLMPVVNERFPIRDLLAACNRYRRATRRRIFVEYLMLEGINDQPEHAKELANRLGDEGFHVNLISYNPTGSTYVGSSDAAVTKFSGILERAGVPASYRISRGRDISAACGQLAAPVAAARTAAMEARRATRRAENAEHAPVLVS